MKCLWLQMFRKMLLHLLLVKFLMKAVRQHPKMSNSSSILTPIIIKRNLRNVCSIKQLLMNYI